MIEQIFFGFIGVALLYLTFRLVHKDKFAFAFFVFVAALVSFLLTATWFQGLMKTGVISSVVSTLKVYGNRLDNFQDTVGNMESELTNHQNQIRMQQVVLGDQEIRMQNSQSEITNHQNSIANQYQRIAEIQNNLAFAQTNLDKQEKQIEDVTFLVDNLFSKMAFEDFAASDTNRVFALLSTNNLIKLFIKLEHVPIIQSLQVSVSSGDEFDIPQQIKPLRIWTHKNILFYGFVNYDVNKTSFSIQYVKDTRETNLVSAVKFQGQNVIFDDGEIPISFF